MRRNKKSRYIEDHEESWAVSYADLLMVLMSFFIVFFNLESGKGEGTGDDQLVDIISRPFKKGQGDKTVENKEKVSVSKNIKNMKASLKGLDIKTTYIAADGETVRSQNKVGLDSLFDEPKLSELKKVKGLLIELEDNTFDIGAYAMNEKTKMQIDSVIEKLTSYKEKISIVAIGHADAIPVKAGKKVIDSNFVLSSLRASKAVEYIVSRGFEKNWVFGQAVSVENRETRSLSIRVYER